MRIRCPALSVNLLLIDWPTAIVRAGKRKATPPKDQETEPSRRRPHHGMPKAQVRKWTSRNRVSAPSISNEAGILTGFEDNEQD